MMPVEGDSSAATQATSGSSARAALAPIGSRSVTPFLAAVSLMAASLGSWLSAGRHQQLAAARVRHAVLGAEGVEQLLAAHAQRRPQAAGRIVDAGVDHLAVARARLRADQLVLLQHHRLMAGQGERARHRQPDDAGPDDNGLHVRRHAPLPCRGAFYTRDAPSRKTRQRLSVNPRSLTFRCMEHTKNIMCTNVPEPTWIIESDFAGAAPAAFRGGPFAWDLFPAAEPPGVQSPCARRRRALPAGATSPSRTASSRRSPSASRPRSASSTPRCSAA